MNIISVKFPVMENGNLTPKSSGTGKRKGRSPNEKEDESKRQKVKRIKPVLTKSLNNLHLTESNNTQISITKFVTRQITPVSSEESTNLVNMADNKVDQTVINSVIAALKEDWVREKMMETVSSKLQEIQESAQALTLEVQTLKETVVQQGQEIKTQGDEIKRLKEKEDSREQNDRNMSLRFAGIPENKLEKPIDTIGNLCTKSLDINLVKGDIMSVYRAGKIPEPGYKGRPRDIVVKFTTINVRINVYTARTKLNKIEGPRIFINEQLNPEQVTLYKETRNRIDWKSGHSSWTFNGNVFIRLSKAKTANSIRIQDIKKLEDILKKAKDNKKDKDGSPGSGPPGSGLAASTSD